MTTITLTLSEDEAALLNTLARERGLNAPDAALHALLQDAAALYDALWDKTFAETQDVLDRLADAALKDIEAGLVD